MRGGNAPAAYSYNPNTVQLDQAVIYFERLPDTVQKDHVDWGFRVAPIYGENYRYTTAYGAVQQSAAEPEQQQRLRYSDGLWRVVHSAGDGRADAATRTFHLDPDIEAQLAPNNYMYSHSMTYTFDNYTNTGLQATWRRTRTGCSS